jgi:hypothetical protein
MAHVGANKLGFHATRAQVFDKSRTGVVVSARDDDLGSFVSERHRRSTSNPGRSAMIQNDHASALAVGDVALVDSSRPVTYVPEDNRGRWLSLLLPRQPLMTHLGFEPQVGRFCGRGGTRAGRLLFQLVLDAAEDDSVSTRVGGT